MEKKSTRLHSPEMILADTEGLTTGKSTRSRSFGAHTEVVADRSLWLISMRRVLALKFLVVLEDGTVLG